MYSERAIVQPQVSLTSFVCDVLADQVRIWSFPRLLLQGKHWRPTLLFLAVTGLLFLVDPFDPNYFRHATEFHAFNLIVSGHNATVAMWTIMIVSLVAGLLRSDRYLTGTFVYAFEAVLNCEILTQVLKGIDRRVRPQDIHTYRHFFDSWFADPGHWYAGPGSFPSGHMIAAMSIATVFAVRYRRQRWAPWVAYGLAATIGFSRITLLSHFPSDVFAATVLGYIIARYVVLRAPEAPAWQESSVPSGAEVAGVRAMHQPQGLRALPYREAEPSE